MSAVDPRAPAGASEEGTDVTDEAQTSGDDSEDGGVTAEAVEKKPDPKLPKQATIQECNAMERRNREKQKAEQEAAKDES